ncbi:MAG: hypothetical protein EPO32_10015 [Anaerolineae bacterium]|nr:MAG: hypothetical protein EPO32_10015 [Anaerolineae bacterium]
MTQQPTPRISKGFLRALPYIVLAVLLVLATWLRTVGLDWDEDQSLHPDERFLTSVLTRIEPVENIGQYFDTETSTLNPRNKDMGFYVYGTLPLFLTRYVGEWIDRTGWGDINLVGRALSAFMDLGIIFLVYLLAERLYGKRVALVAAIFSTFTVAQIQQSHFFTVDNFLSFFTFLAVTTAAFISTEPLHREDKDGLRVVRDFQIGPFLLFGLALGMAVASKVNAAVVCLMLPLAVAVRMLRMTPEERAKVQWSATAYLVAGAIVSVLAFRIFQPYAFNGPSFFNFSLNSGWLDTLRSLLAQQTGDVDWPPSIQWARRPVWFSAQNIILWGMGLPMALMAFGGYLAAAWRSLRGEWHKHAVLLAWVGMWFLWESSKFNPTMRYQLPSYPGFTVLAGFAVIALWDWARARAAAVESGWRKALPAVAGVAGALALVLTAVWAFAFVSIYQRPVTRVAATRWIYQNIPGPLTVHYDNSLGGTNQPLSVPYGFAITELTPYQIQFIARASGDIDQIALHEIRLPAEQRNLVIQVFDEADSLIPLVTASATVTFPQEGSIKLADQVFTPTSPALLLPDNSYQVRIELAPGQPPVNLRSAVLHLLSPNGGITLTLVDSEVALTVDAPLVQTFRVDTESTFAELVSRFALSPTETPAEQTLRLTLSANPDFTQILGVAEVPVSFDGSLAGAFVFDAPIPVNREQTLYIRLENLTPGGAVTLLGSAIANETDWDDGLPLRADGYDGYGGIYQRDFNFDIYADNNPGQLQHILETLDDAEFIAISSSRQWGSTPRIPERYPLNIVYYRALIGCPDDITIDQCYAIAAPGMFEGKLGFELIQVFVNNPTLGPLVINDQLAEEAFTVYDHPKVFIFRKTADYDPEAVAALFSVVDLTQVQRLTPKQASGQVEETKSLLLPPERLEIQRAGGTWRELYNVNGLVNAWQPLTVVIWYLFILLLGWLVYPIVRWAFPGLPDRGYPLARGFGLLLLAYFVWLGGSLGIPATRWMILAVLVLLAVVSGLLAYRQRAELAAELRQRLGYFLRVEAIFLAAFLVMLLVRLGNPELWHPGKGGEKPMDFAYFNAILRSATFPPYDPWFAGGYINYYYWGFVFVGVPVKLLGIVPSVAYNLIIPTLVGLLSLGVFSAIWNLYQSARTEEEPSGLSSYWVGLAGVVGVVFLGNLGTVRMIFRGLARIGSLGVYDAAAPFWTQWGWAARGLYENLVHSAGLPYGWGDWYWIPSRAIPAPNDVEPITEFPWFTFIYADLHAHMMALPVTLLAVGFMLAVLLGKGWRGQHWSQVVASLVLGGIAIGSLLPINTWDLPTYLALAAVVVLYAVSRYGEFNAGKLKEWLTPEFLRATLALVFTALLGMLAIVVVFKPFGDWYAFGYGSARLWDGTKTPIGSYLVHWGLPLFLIVAWLLVETRDWLARTPLSALRKLQPNVGLFGLLGLVAAVALLWMHSRGIRIHWVAIPLALWVTILLLRRDQPDAKRLTLFLIGTGLFLTLMVETIVLQGDIGRMNTVFKFYLQVWVMFGIAAALALGWTAQTVKAWLPGLRVTWLTGLSILALSAFLFTLSGTAFKIIDRYSPEAPLTLDGMDYMLYAEYPEQSQTIHLYQDHAAILWLQQNVDGSPVIVEAKLPGEYRLGSRISINTGLPAVLGWQWHQIQQRVAGPPGVVEARAGEIQQFYANTDVEFARLFIEKYDVRYIIVGELELATYGPVGLRKFEQQDGILWREVYRFEGMTIYEVLPAAAEAD